MARPWHAEQLTSGLIVVSHHRPIHEVSVVDKNGLVVTSYANAGAGRLKLRAPKQLVVLTNGCILVADSGNDRIVALNPSLSCIHVSSIPVDGGLKGPSTLHVDESRGRLYIGEYDAGRLLAYDYFVNDSCKLHEHS